MLAVEHGIAVQALTSFNFHLEGVRDEVVRIVGQGKQEASGHIPFTPRAKKIFELSLREALQLGHNYIGTEHILLGLIREGEGVAAQILVYVGDELPTIRQEVIRLLSTGNSDEPDVIVKEGDPRQPGLEPSPDLTLGQHIAEFVDLDVPASQYENVDISWYSHENDRRAGYFTVKYTWVNGGSLSYTGVHHPDAVCEGEGICIHCGRTLDFGT